ncbi:hypothetical protein D3C81_777080 [compost metagenome]
MVVGAGQGKDVGSHLLEVNRRAAHFQCIRADQWIVFEHLDQIAVERCRQSCGVVVPEQDVEHRRLVAQQVVVDPVVPDQVVGAHPGEDFRHIAAFQHAGLVRMTLGGLKGLLVDEQGYVAVQGGVQHAHQQGEGIDLVLADRGVVAQQRGAGDAAGAGAEHVQVFAAGDGGDYVDRFLERLDVGRQAPLALFLGRVAPADDEGLHIVAQAEPRQALVRAQVEDVELVDLRRHHQQRTLVDLLGDRFVLDQFQHIVAEHHRAFGHAQALADLERAHVDLARHAAVVHHVLGEMRETVEQAFAAGFEKAFDCRRVGRRVGRGEGFGHQVDHEVPAGDILGPKVTVVDPFVEFLAPRQISLQITFVERVLAPGRIREATVIAGRQQLGFAEQHVLEFKAEMSDMPGAVYRLFDGLPEHHSSRSQ